MTVPQSIAYGTGGRISLIKGFILVLNTHCALDCTWRKCGLSACRVVIEAFIFRRNRPHMMPRCHVIADIKPTSPNLFHRPCWSFGLLFGLLGYARGIPFSRFPHNSYFSSLTFSHMSIVTFEESKTVKSYLPSLSNRYS